MPNTYSFAKICHLIIFFLKNKQTNKQKKTKQNNDMNFF